MKRRVIISAVNFTEGGPLTVLRDCLDSAAQTLDEHWEIIALVHDKDLIVEPRVKFFEFRSAKSSWINRLFLEWYGFRKKFGSEEVDIWLSLHDVTPLVCAKKQAVYCHNPSPFYNLSAKEAILEPKLWIFNMMYAFVYRAFINRNDLVIVQQEWLRTSFTERYGNLPILVAHPDVKTVSAQMNCGEPENSSESARTILLYPTLPRVFKNIETILEAMKLLSPTYTDKIELRVTISGDENAYARSVYARYRGTNGVKFVGRQTRDEMANQYREAFAVLFPSKLETWGLPISEAKAYRKRLLVADLPYAHETVGTYGEVSFLDPNSPRTWASAFQELSSRTWKPSEVTSSDIPEPYSNSWNDLWKILVERP